MKLMTKEEFYIHCAVVSTKCSKCGMTGKWIRQPESDTDEYLYFTCQCGNTGIYYKVAD